jgi:hypothetical protein
MGRYYCGVKQGPGRIVSRLAKTRISVLQKKKKKRKEKNRRKERRGKKTLERGSNREIIF